MQILKWLLAVIVLCGAGGAQAQWSPQWGGPGGTNFATACDATDHARQFNVRAGAAIDGLQMACNDTDNPARNILTPWFGGTGGTPSTLYCGKYMTGVSIYYDSGTYVNSLQFTCRAKLIAGTPATQSSSVGWKLGTFASYSCPTGQAFTGVRGAGASLLDRVSFLCQKRGPN